MTVEDVKRTDTGSAILPANEAVVRWALEANVKVMAFCPGSPTSEILDRRPTFTDQVTHSLKGQVGIRRSTHLE